MVRLLLYEDALMQAGFDRKVRRCGVRDGVVDGQHLVAGNMDVAALKAGAIVAGTHLVLAADTQAHAAQEDAQEQKTRHEPDDPLKPRRLTAPRQDGTV